jgi:fermentation-respiration switch protein FrsA (DUF1100 family)
MSIPSSTPSTRNGTANNGLARRFAQRLWPFARLFAIAYLIVVLGTLLLETWLVYPAPPVELGDWNPAGLNHEEVSFTSADGTKLHGWFVPHPQPKRAILYCHGNGEHIAFNANLAAQLRDSLFASVLLFDYRGYGRSDGRPSEPGCVADGRAAQRWLADRADCKPRDIVLMGRSLGSAVAVALAAEEGARALVVENGFTSMPEIAARHFPWLPVHWLMRNRYDCLSWIARYDGPVLQSHGVADTLIPISMARRLFDAAPSQTKRWLEFDDLDHNSPWPPHYYDELAAFLDAPGPATRIPHSEDAIPVDSRL